MLFIINIFFIFLCLNADVFDTNNEKNGRKSLNRERARSTITEDLEEIEGNFSIDNENRKSTVDYFDLFKYLDENENENENESTIKIEEKNYPKNSISKNNNILTKKLEELRIKLLNARDVSKYNKNEQINLTASSNIEENFSIYNKKNESAKTYSGIKKNINYHLDKMNFFDFEENRVELKKKIAKEKKIFNKKGGESSLAKIYNYLFFLKEEKDILKAFFKFLKRKEKIIQLIKRDYKNNLINEIEKENLIYLINILEKKEKIKKIEDFSDGINKWLENKKEEIKDLEENEEEEIKDGKKEEFNISTIFISTKPNKNNENLLYIINKKNRKIYKLPNFAKNEIKAQKYQNVFYVIKSELSYKKQIFKQKEKDILILKMNFLIPKKEFFEKLEEEKEDFNLTVFFEKINKLEEEKKGILFEKANDEEKYNFSYFFDINLPRHYFKKNLLYEAILNKKCNNKNEFKKNIANINDKEYLKGENIFFETTGKLKFFEDINSYNNFLKTTIFKEENELIFINPENSFTDKKKKTKVINKKKTEVVDEKKTKVINKKKTEVVDEKKTEVVDEKKTEVVDEKKTKVVDEKKTEVVDEKKTLFNFVSYMFFLPILIIPFFIWMIKKKEKENNLII